MTCVMLPLWLVLLSSVSDSYSLRLLGFFPYPGASHHQAFVPILLELARRGHQVVYLTPVRPKISYPNLDVRLMKDFKRLFFEKIDVIRFGQSTYPGMTERLYSTVQATAHHFFGDEEVQAVIHGTDSFDAVLLESYFHQEPGSALMHKFGCVAVEISSFGNHAWLNEMSGLPDNAAYQIDYKTPYSDELSTLEMLHNFYSTWSTVLVSYYHLWKIQSIMDQYFNYTGWESRPSIYRLVSNRSMILVNRHVALDYPYPKAPHVKDIGGVNIVPNKPLPEDIQRFMDGARHGVIYVSLGSNLQTSDILTGEIGQAFFKVFTKIPQRVIMKWEIDGPLLLPRSVMTSRWLPQQDILAHNSCVLFISHGGYMSLTESVYHGVPLVGIPFFADQSKNMKQVETAGYGVKLQIENITQESILWALEEVHNNPSYKKEALKRSRMMRESDRPAVETAADWVEYAIKYPNALTPRAAFLSFIQLHMVDIFMFIFMSVLLVYKLISSIVLKIISILYYDEINVY